MPQVLVWQCPRTRKLFHSKERYKRHLRNLARKQFETRTYEAFQCAFRSRIEKTLWRASSFVDIENWFLDPENQLFLAERLRRTYPDCCERLDPTKFRITEIKFNRMQWSDMCPNGHHAPRGEVTNWHTKDHLPKGFPGWRGTLDYTLENADQIWQQIFDHCGICLGSGGGRGKFYRHQVTLFAQDWSALTVMTRMVDGK